MNIITTKVHKTQRWRQEPITGHITPWRKHILARYNTTNSNVLKLYVPTSESNMQLPDPVTVDTV